MDPSVPSDIQTGILDVLLATTDDAVIVTNKDGIVRLANSRAEELYGAKVNEIIGRSTHDLFTLQNRKGNRIVDLVHPLTVALTKKILTNHAPFIMVTREDRKIPVELSVSPFLAGSGEVPEGVVMVIRDKTAEEEVTFMKTEFVPFAAHQLRTPLGSMRWNLEILLAGRLGTIPAPLVDTIKNIYDGTQQMIRLVNDLLNLSRIDEGKIPNDPEDVDIAVLIRSVVHEMETLADKRAVKITMDIPDSLPKLYLDPSRFSDVMQNIVSNAVKFNAIGGTVTIRTALEGAFLKVSVTDTGMGIPKEEKKQIFEKFFRAANAVASQTEGTGLGLYVVKYYISEWGGTVDIASIEGKGTTVTLGLPLITQKG